MTPDGRMVSEFVIAAISMTVLQVLVRLVGGGGLSVRIGDVVLSLGLALIFVIGRRVGRRP